MFALGEKKKAVLKLIFYWRLKMLVVKMGEKEEEEWVMCESHEQEMEGACEGGQGKRQQEAREVSKKMKGRAKAVLMFLAAWGFMRG